MQARLDPVRGPSVTAPQTSITLLNSAAIRLRQLVFRFLLTRGARFFGAAGGSAAVSAVADAVVRAAVADAVVRAPVADAAVRAAVGPRVQPRFGWAARLTVMPWRRRWTGLGWSRR